MTDDIPEYVLKKPESENPDLIPAIADKLGVTVSMLRAQPEDVLELMRRIYIQTQQDDSAFRMRMQQLLRMQDISPRQTVELAVEQSTSRQNTNAQFTFTRKRLQELAAAARLNAAQSRHTAEKQEREKQEEIERKQGGN